MRIHLLSPSPFLCLLETLMFLKNTNQLLYSLIWTYFLMIRFRLWIFGRNITEMMSYSSQLSYTRRHMMKLLYILKNISYLPWLVWLSGLSTGLRIQRSLVQFPVRAHAWVAGQVPGWEHLRGSLWMFLLYVYVSLPLFLPPFLSLSQNK